ncbi:hypothetical protein BN1723_004323 [Verticillium longisporum]|uniref:Uncharacterized protein n=1 Tax=Verticillium longisporum TaxID=100787 RepID=A0A0G4MSU3_VERLO|nr:hypothetical protein BN1723_004323 [Verticillium longisporum]
MQLDTGKRALLSLHRSDETNGAVHVARDINKIANDKVIAANEGAGGARRPARRRGRHSLSVGRIAQHGVEAVALAGIGDGGEGRWRQGGQGALARQEGGARG